MRHRLTTLAACCLAAVFLIPAGTATTARAQALPAMTCTGQAYAVTLAPGIPATVTGQLCSRGPATGKPLFVAEPGASYDHDYWNWPQGPAHYSFAWAATLAGFAVLALDQPGTPPAAGPGYPPATALTISDDAAALHQVIGAQHTSRIILIGHSVGSYIALTEAATWHDPKVTGLALTGALSQSNQAGQAQVISSVYPAQLDPKFAADNLPAGYLTTQPGTRGPDFYAAGDADPAVIAKDEVLKATTTGNTLAGITAAQDPALSRAVTVPVLEEVGQADMLNCGPGLSCANPAAIRAREAGDWTVPLSAFVLGGAGHDLTTALNGPAATAAVIIWALTV